jgi:hypothetical protein
MRANGWVLVLFRLYWRNIGSIIIYQNSAIEWVVSADLKMNVRLWSVHFNWSGCSVPSFFFQVSLLSDGTACHLVRDFRKCLWFISGKMAS